MHHRQLELLVRELRKRRSCISILNSDKHLAHLQRRRDGSEAVAVLRLLAQELVQALLAILQLVHHALRRLLPA